MNPSTTHWPDLNMPDLGLIKLGLDHLNSHCVRQINHHVSEGDETQVHYYRVMKKQTERLSQKSEELSLSI